MAVLFVSVKFIEVLGDFIIFQAVIFPYPPLQFRPEVFPTALSPFLVPSSLPSLVFHPLCNSLLWLGFHRLKTKRERLGENCSCQSALNFVKVHGTLRNMNLLKFIIYVEQYGQNDEDQTFFPTPLTQKSPTSPCQL